MSCFFLFKEQLFLSQLQVTAQNWKMCFTDSYFLIVKQMSWLCVSSLISQIRIRDGVRVSLNPALTICCLTHGI